MSMNVKWYTTIPGQYWSFSSMFVEPVQLMTSKKKDFGVVSSKDFEVKM